jgi:hypothetical protein
MATVSAGTTWTYSEWGGISQPVLGIKGTPNPPTQMVWSQLLRNLNILVALKALTDIANITRISI